MLPNKGTPQRRNVSGSNAVGNSIRWPSKNPRRKSKFDRRRAQMLSEQTTIYEYIIYGLTCMAVFVTFIFFISAISKSNASKGPPLDAVDVIPQLMGEELIPGADLQHMLKHSARASDTKLDSISDPDPKASELSTLPYTVVNPNAVKVTFKIYANEQCDDSDPTQSVTVSMESQDVDADSKGTDCPLCYSFCGKQFESDPDRHLNDRGVVKSIRIISNEISAQLDLYNDCGIEHYESSIFDFEGCVRIHSYPNTAGIRVRRNVLIFPQTLPPPISDDKLPPLQQHLLDEGVSDESKALAKREDIPSYLIVYSCESSEYCGFQAQTNYYGFLSSGQHPTKASFLRLLTAGEPDDMASYIPTFTAPRNAESRRYSPYNKADVLVKWFQSPPNLPEQEIVVVIDPDNWIIRDITHWVVKASKGHPLGEAAWFNGNQLVTQLWKEVCLKNCDWDLDMVGVPYIVHKDDLREIAPFFKMYIDIMKEKEDADHAFLKRYKNIQMGWGTEMFAYIFGAAHAGIKHEVVHGIQIRDVSSVPKTKAQERSLDMIHMGRIWWPHDYALGRKFMHTEGRTWAYRGVQVWCKCNYTASDVIPWPMPERDHIGFQSYHTGYLLYYGRQYFGEMPVTKYRKKGKSYNWKFP